MSSSADPFGNSTIPAGKTSPIDGAPDHRNAQIEERHYPVAVSVEQLALGWLRTEGASNGSVVTVDHEIGGRQRLGIPWRVPAAQSFSCAVILRCAIRLEDEALLWIAALVGAARAIETIAVSAPGLGWPDSLIGRDGVTQGSVAVEAQLGPGIVQSAVVSLRVNIELLSIAQELTRPIAKAFSEELTLAVGLLETTHAELLWEYNVRSVLIGERVRVRLLPKGDTRGTVGPVNGTGNLPLESPSGMIELLNPSTVLSVVPI
jgi:biotin-(acetyl-CoA carboxylase) ligase